MHAIQWRRIANNAFITVSCKMQYFFFFRFSAQGQVPDTIFSMFLDTVPSPSAPDMCVYCPSPSSSLTFSVLACHFAFFLLLCLPKYLLNAVHGKKTFYMLFVAISLVNIDVVPQGSNIVLENLTITPSNLTCICEFLFTVIHQLRFLRDLVLAIFTAP